MTRSHPVFLLCAVIAAGLLQMVFPWNGFSGTPHMVIVEPNLDFGPVTNGFLLQHDFCISNSGDAPLIINRILSSCNACLHVAIEKTNVPPGEGTVVHSLLDLRLLNGPVTRTV